MIKLKPEDVAAFDVLNVRAKAQTATFTDFLQQYQAMQEQLASDSQAHWTGIKARYGLEGDWRFDPDSGRLIAVPSPNAINQPDVATLPPPN